MKVGVYFQSWSSHWASFSETLDLAEVDADIIYLAFARPDCTYRSGQNTFAGTGLDFSSNFDVIKGAIKILQSKGKIVMLSVGGATYNFTNPNYYGIEILARDLGCDGIDLDWEASVWTKNQFGDIIASFKFEDLKLSAAVFSVGAYGEGKYIFSKPQSAYTGMNLQGLQKNGWMLDWINIMAYDASDEYNPLEAVDAYSEIYHGPIYLGLEVGQQAWGGALLTLDQVHKWTDYMTMRGGVFVWSYQKYGNPGYSDILKYAKSLGGSVDVPEVPRPPNPSPIPSVPDTIPDTPDTAKTDPPDCPCPCHLRDDWKPWKNYSKGDLVYYYGTKYTCIQGHTSQPDWIPSNVPALWQKD